MKRTGFYAYIILEYDRNDGNQDTVSDALNEALKANKDLPKELLLNGIRLIGIGVTGDSECEDCD
jgi:hypothetical protein